MALDKKITRELKEEGLIRDLSRQLQDMRKEAGLTRKNTILIVHQAGDESLEELFDRWAEYLKKETLAGKISLFDKNEKYLLTKDWHWEDKKLKVAIKKIK